VTYLLLLLLLLVNMSIYCFAPKKKVNLFIYLVYKKEKRAGVSAYDL